MKTIKQKILAGFLILVGASVILCGGTGILTNFTSAQSMLEQTLTSTAGVAAERVSYELTMYRNMAQDLGMMPSLSDDTVSAAEKEEIVNSWAEKYGMERGNLLDLSGDSLFDGNNYADREYFQQAVQGNSWISTPTISRITGELSIMVAAPVWENGRDGGTIAGVVYFVPKETFLNDIMTSIKVSANSGAYMIGSDGTTVADTTLETVAVQNIEEEAKTDSSLNQLAALHADMRAGGTGYGSYTMDGESRYLAYAPVEGSNGWSIGITAPASDFLSSTYTSVVIILVLLAVIVVVSVFIAIFIANHIALPIKACSERLRLLEDGDLTSPSPVFERKDEIGILSHSTNTVVETLQGLIGDVGYLLEEMSNGNFDIRSRNYDLYQGDYQQLLLSVRRINRKLSRTLTQINLAAEQVSSGAEQVSSGAQALAQGATEQASSVEELSATIAEIDNGAKENSSHAQQMKEMSDQAGSQVNMSQEKMAELKNAMADILNGHKEIGQIIETIENIAFQTNILALNAAVEAARAGSAGKGFAVVADEVRNLASKSDQASKQTKEIIERSAQNVAKGNELMEAVDEALSKTSEISGEVLGLINTMVGNIVTEANAVSQVTSGTDQISSVVQTNSATAEESAAASEELSSQAQLLKELVGRFTLRQDDSSEEEIA